MGARNYGEAPRGWGCRHTIALLVSFGSAVSYSMRFNLSIAIVAMVAPRKSHDDKYIYGNSSIACPNLLEPTHSFALPSHSDNSGNGETTIAHHGEFQWTEVEQGVILGSFFWGYILTQIPGGILTKRYGGKWPLGFGLLISAVFALLTPWAARTSKQFLIAARVIQGMGSGMHICSEMSMMAAWAPPHERSTFASIAYGGTYIGTAVTLIVSGYLINAGVMGGWPSVFYVSGHATIVWFVLWALLAFSHPSDHPRISREEKSYLDYGTGTDDADVVGPTPWKEVLTSMAVWSNVVAQVAHCWVIYTLLTEMPTFMSTVLHFDIRKNSWMSAMPYLTSTAFGILLANCADGILKREWMNTLSIRKLAQLIAHGGSALALIGAAYSGCDRTLSVMFLISAVSLSGAVHSGFMVNYVDLAPNHAGMIMGAANTIANVCGIGAPYVAGLLINNNPSVESWSYVFLICAGIFIFSCIFYLVFASGEELAWNQFKKLEYDGSSIVPGNQSLKTRWFGRRNTKEFVIQWED